jgi:hypothetical protein
MNLQISMHDIISMQIFDGLQSLIEETVDLSGSRLGTGLEERGVIFEETTIFSKIHDHVDFIIIEEGIP